jgi:hypothetical protein
MIHVNANELQLCQTFNGVHSEIVRSIYWNPQVIFKLIFSDLDYNLILLINFVFFSLQTNIFLTGGEDSMLCLWGPQ